MTMRMLIDARHREETRVAVVKGNRIEEFDFESVEHQQIKGNIYLAKVTRVEPSLQAAFVDYGGNRHGFLAFSEIHPDYYQIPKEDREALLREEAEHAAEEEALRAAEEDLDPQHDDDGQDHSRPDSDSEDGDDEAPELAEVVGGHHDEVSGNGGSAADSLRHKRMNLRRRYKIQDVIHRRQVLLVQVVKEERGNKGAALTTYLSLAGRYCVLMPNTTSGGGISRKISNVADRKRLKTIMADLDLPSTMGCIVRTAGLQRTKIEIKRDFDYLARLWDGIRATTLGSSAPALIYTDSDLIRRAIRDIYNKDIDEVIVEGEEGFRAAREFMKQLMPSHARKVKPYADAVPLYQRNGVEDQLAAMYQPIVQLKSGGYLVINPTEALVSIDINSGRSTREYGIEATAVGTNLEAAHEIARQLRLRDMAGLVVIDFIDMENGGNIRKVEKAMKLALADDRARIQVGRISSFGLLEMSRQRLRTGVLEASTKQCPHCEGSGLVRTASSAGLSALRVIEDEAARGKGSLLTMRASQEAAFYLLNRKRHELAEIEQRYGVKIEVLSDGETEGARMVVQASGPPPAFTPKFEAIVYEDDVDTPYEADDDEDLEAKEQSEPSSEHDENGRKKRSRRRRGRRGRTDGSAEQMSDAAVETSGMHETQVEPVASEAFPKDNTETGDESEVRKRPRRGRRGGRRRREGQLDTQQEGDGYNENNASSDSDVDAGNVDHSQTGDDDISAPVEPVVTTEPTPAVKPKRVRKAKVEDLAAVELSRAENIEEIAEKPKRARKAKAEAPPAPETTDQDSASPSALVDDVATPSAPKRARKAKPATEAVEAVPAPPISPVADPKAIANVAPVQSDPSTDAATDESPRRGWWQRTFGE